MAEYTDIHGVSYTDDDIERWAAEAESDAAYTGKHLGPARPGRPVSVGVEARPFTLRLDAERRSKLTVLAHQQGTTPSQLIRDLIDALPENNDSAGAPAPHLP